MMSRTLEQIARVLKDSSEKVKLIYAFNGTGKTRLSREMKKIFVKNNSEEEVSSIRKKYIYYSSFTEDLFYWVHDFESDAVPKLKIQPNTFTDWILKDQGQDQNIIANFQNYTNNKLNPTFNEAYKTHSSPGEKAITIPAFSEVTFSIEGGNNTLSRKIKISKGEESSFIWSVFYTLLDEIITILNVAEPTERETDQFDQLEQVFIDDPVSSLDENNLIKLGVNLGNLIKSSESKLKFIITTHNALFYNIIYNECQLKKGYLLRTKDDGTYDLIEKRGDSNKSFSYHLYVKELIEEAVKQGNVQRFHFALLRNLYEKTAQFLGYPKWSDLLPDEQKTYAARIMNFYNHSTLSSQEIAEPTEPEKKMVGFLLNNLNKFGYWQKDKQK